MVVVVGKTLTEKALLCKCDFAFVRLGEREYRSNVEAKEEGTGG